MGIGDNLMATGMARGAALRGKKIAFGDGLRIHWDKFSDVIFKNNPNVAHPDELGDERLEWVPFYRGQRIYNIHAGDRWEWNYSFRPTPGELFFTADELKFADDVERRFGRNFILIEPNVPRFKTVAANKDWGLD